MDMLPKPLLEPYVSKELPDIYGDRFIKVYDLSFRDLCTLIHEASRGSSFWYSEPRALKYKTPDFRKLVE